MEGHTTYVRALTFSSDGQTVFSGSEDGTIRSWDIKTGTQKYISKLPGEGNRLSYIRTIAIAPEAGLVATGWWDLTIRISELSSGRLLHRISTPGFVERLGFSPDGKMCVAGVDSGDVLHITALDATAQPSVYKYRGHHLPDRIDVRHMSSVYTCDI